MDIYDELINIINTEPDLEEFLTHESKWEYLYNLSHIRQNVYDWYDFDPESDLLEIGAECGAVTGLFTERVRGVVAVDVDERKCIVNRVRNKKAENLSIIQVESYDKADGVKNGFEYASIIGELSEEKLLLAEKSLGDKGLLLVAGDDPKAEALLTEKGFLIKDKYFASPDYIFPLEIRRDENKSSSYIYICEKRVTLA